MKKISCLIGLVILAIAFGYFFYKYEYVFAEGVKTGQVNYITYKGYIFKTWEGKIIQAGIKSQNQSIQSNEFVFSVESEEVAKQIQSFGDHTISVHYSEYLGILPWRGNSVFVVDSVVGISPEAAEQYNRMHPDAQIESSMPAVQRNNVDEDKSSDWFD